MKPLSSLALIEQGEVRRLDRHRLIYMKGNAVAHIGGRDGSPWKVFPTQRGNTLLAITDEDFHDALLDWAAREHRGEKTSDVEVLLIRRLAQPGEIDQATTLVPQLLAAQEAQQ